MEALDLIESKSDIIRALTHAFKDMLFSLTLLVEVLTIKAAILEAD